MADIVPYLERICARFAQPEMRAAFRGFAKTMQFTFPDLQRDFTLSIAEDGSATLAEQTLPRPDVRVTANSDLLAGIIDRTVNPIQAYITRKLKVTGQMEDLLRLQKLL
ncbi:MAG TPA: SCP2 sterol-binding domain-containing protein [Ktedonosporobacter sp.]|jgi:putative sterol carrier protein|nr:SCP2 sterol-binding domain-containing protein [Ktedonosporobacter sp.]